MLNRLLRLGLSLPKPLSSILVALCWTAFWERERKSSEVQTGGALPDLSRSERAVLVRKICDYYPVETLLELGAGYAQNFHIIGPLLSKTVLVGIDADSNRVEGGQAFLRQQGIMNARLLQADARDLSSFDDGSFDLVISCGFMLYLPPSELGHALFEAVRVARRAVLLLEQHIVCPEGALPGTPAPGEKPYWLHDFVRAAEAAVPDVSAEVVPVPSPVWSTEEWRRFAHLIVLTVHNDQRQ